MNSETRICQNCGKRFTIEPEDFEFYQKINVPPPTFCPDCRLQRRMSFYNLRKLYKRKCDFSGKSLISIYHPDGPYKVYHQEIWHSDKWDPVSYGREYDFSRPFFEQFDKLMKEIPWPHKLLDMGNVNCDYCVGTLYSKNCYMCAISFSEDCLYVYGMKDKNSIDCLYLQGGELCYENIDCNNNYKVFFSQYTDNCIESAFLYNCRNLSNCFCCVNLRNKSYHIFNKPYSKEEYKKEIQKYDLGSYQNLLKIKEKFNKFKLKFPHKYAYITHSYNVVGNNIRDCKNCYWCFDTVRGVEDCKYIIAGGKNLKDSYDIVDAGSNSQLIYEGVMVGLGGCWKVFFSVNVVEGCRDVQYSMNCYNCHNLFGCIGLRHKSYCILNKQYTKEEYEKLVPKIIEHMNKIPYVDKKGRVYKYGEFFPIELSPFSYNETIAQEYFPLTKEQAIEQGYSWYEKPKSEYKPTIKAKDLPDHIKDVKDSITKEIIECASCAKASEDKQNQCQGSGVYRILPQELEFYRKMNLPLPRLCPDCRHYERIKQRNPLKLYKRKCDKCGKEILTTYSPDRPEIVYCEKCYLKEIG
ncbi:hypothetical protein J7K44_00780 [bacterium]|nr:hypothetical protein [bacterium]